VSKGVVPSYFSALTFHRNKEWWTHNYTVVYNALRLSYTTHFNYLQFLFKKVA